jgi:hypothetical protein
MNYDSTAETLKHIRKVNEYLINASCELLERAKNHDQSKLEEPEKSTFDEVTPLIAGLTFGSEEYTEATRQIKPLLTIIIPLIVITRNTMRIASMG